MSRIFLPTLLAAFLASAGRNMRSADEPELPLAYKGPRGEASPLTCKAEVRVEPANVPRGGTVRVSCALRCMSGSASVYNAFLSDQYHLPATIVITSADGNLRQQLFAPKRGPRQNSDASSWVQLSESQSIGRIFRLHVAGFSGGRPDRPWASPELDLPPGEYLVQAIYNHWIAARRPNRESAVRKGEIDSNDGEPQPSGGRSIAEMEQPFFVSEAVRLTVMDSAAERANEPGAPAGPIELRVALHENRAKLGRKVTGEITITNQSDGPLTLYNPHLNHFLMARNRAMSLLIFDAEGRGIGDLLTFRGGSSLAGPRVRDWLTAPPGGMTSAVVTFEAGSVPGTEFYVARELPPGKYVIDARAHRPLISGPPRALLNFDDTEEASRDATYLQWRESFPGPEICRSNRVELEILPRTGD